MSTLELLRESTHLLTWNRLEAIMFYHTKCIKRVKGRRGSFGRSRRRRSANGSDRRRMRCGLPTFGIGIGRKRGCSDAAMHCRCRMRMDTYVVSRRRTY